MGYRNGKFGLNSFYRGFDIQTINTFPFQRENSVELVDRRHINSYMKNSMTKKNSFMIAKLNTLDGETIATNFLLLDKIKNSENIRNPELSVNFCF